MTKPTGRPRGRPKVKEYVTLMARVDVALADQVKRYASTAFRKFVLSYSRLFGHGILGYREQLRDEFSRPFGKEAPYANTHCSPHHFIAKRSYRSASGRARPFHTTITGVTRTHGLKGG